MLGAAGVKEKGVGIALKRFKDAVSGVKQMLEPARLAEFRKNVGAQNNRAIFEIPEILAALLGESSESMLHVEEFIRASKAN